VSGRPWNVLGGGDADLPEGQLVRVDNTASDAQFLALAEKYAPGTSATTDFGGVGKIGLLNNPHVNTGKTRASGFDFDAGGRFDTALGQVRLKREGTYLWKYQEFSVADNAYDDNLSGTYGMGSRMKAKFRANLKAGSFDHGMTVNYASGFSNLSVSSPTYCVTNNVSSENMANREHVGSNTTVDYNLTYSGIKNTRLSLYVDNLFERDAPIQWRAGYAETFRFRRIGVTASYTFL